MDSHPHAFRYEHCDVPPAMTLAEWRRAQGRPRRRRRGIGAALSALLRPRRGGLAA